MGAGTASASGTSWTSAHSKRGQEGPGGPAAARGPSPGFSAHGGGSVWSFCGGLPGSLLDDLFWFSRRHGTEKEASVRRKTPRATLPQRGAGKASSAGAPAPQRLSLWAPLAGGESLSEGDSLQVRDISPGESQLTSCLVGDTHFLRNWRRKRVITDSFQQFGKSEQQAGTGALPVTKGHYATLPQ